MLGDKQFYDGSFQPRIVFRYNIDGISVYTIRFGSDYTFGVPVQESKDIKVWVHEFIEFCVQELLTEYGRNTRISLFYTEGLEGLTWNQDVSHIVTSATSTSMLDGQIVDADTYWRKLMEAYSKR